ncbi:phage conserved hypothetical protein TIGR01671 [Fusobacterium gonidiaformans 3-1-5R]|uniref:YopX protein domain-containing protein n=1 Tax=Fusobacterium gonidiaformans 3-1-5R TaxID=469605 RepID=E5BFM2_9FUSO|nr:YopX family protein [Fusobacterium gonidiaformans]EFS20903.1 phage conserved hypothetical protein TIGR01671 [Fusobacterium gonidiaformans 3-1-5R]
MREIKFRAFLKKDKCICKVLAVELNKGLDGTLQVEYPDGAKITLNLCSVELMQYTGMQDHKETEIYEGDIVSMEAMTPGASNIVGEVQFLECGYWVVREKEKKAVCLFEEGVYIKKLGNIYENHELLEEK